MRRAGVWVDPDARLTGIPGLRLGRGTEIHRNCTVAAGHLTGRRGAASPANGSIETGVRCYILQGAILATYGGRIVLGDNVSVNPYCLLNGEGGIAVGSDTRIGANTTIYSSSHVYADRTVPVRRQGMTRKGVVIGEDVWIGAGVVILEGVTIGRGAIIGAGSVVNKSVEPWAIVAGVPARTLNYRGAAP